MFKIKNCWAALLLTLLAVAVLNCRRSNVAMFPVPALNWEGLPPGNTFLGDGMIWGPLSLCFSQFVNKYLSNYFFYLCGMLYKFNLLFTISNFGRYTNRESRKWGQGIIYLNITWTLQFFSSVITNAWKCRWELEIISSITTPFVISCEKSSVYFWN